MRELKFKSFLRKLTGRERLTSQGLLAQLRQEGAHIGSDVHIYAPATTVIDRTAPWLLSIGDHVRIADGVKILTHDYSWSVLKSYTSDTVFPGNILGAQSPVSIGSHVFIGMNAIITRGVTVEDHVIIGAGSVVTRDCAADGVYAGNPAKRIMNMEEFYRKRSALQFSEARQLALRYRERRSAQPPKEIFSEYFLLFSTCCEAEKVPVFRAQMERMGNFDDSARYMREHKPMFPDYESFLAACYRQD